MPPPSPTVAAWELQLRLRKTRKALDVDVNRIAKALGCTRNHWSLVENGHTVLTEDKLHKALDLFEVEDDQRAELLALRKLSKERGWWDPYASMLGEPLTRQQGLEHGAQRIRIFGTLIFPGHLQSEEYARALISGNIFVPQVEIEDRLAIRLRRQQRLTDTDPLYLTAAVSQAALTQEVGGKAALGRQLQHLAAVIEANPETVDIRVLPFNASASGIFGASSFHLLDFSSPYLPTSVWHESSVSGGFVAQSAVRSIDSMFAQALTESCGRAESLDLIRELAAGLS